MKNGHAKEWLKQLIKVLLTCLCDDKADIHSWAPCPYENTNISMETIFGDLDDAVTQMEYNSAPCLSTSSSTSSSSLSSFNLESTRDTEAAEFLPEFTRQDKKRIVPDFCISLPDFPGVFPLVLEIKPAYQETHGLVQNMQQMLSKLFFQDIVFGVVVSPTLFQLSVIIKKDKDLYFASTPCMTFRGIHSNLDLKELNTMCTFIFRVLKWTLTAKCMLANPASQ